MERSLLDIIKYDRDRDLVWKLLPSSSKEDKTACLSFAVRIKDPSFLKLLLEGGVGVNYSDEFEETALMEAAKNSYMPCLKLLVDHKSDVNAGNCDGRTALHFSKDPEVTRYLLVHGGSPSLTIHDWMDLSPLNLHVRSRLDDVLNQATIQDILEQAIEKYGGPPTTTRLSATVIKLDEHSSPYDLLDSDYDDS
jgi:ankyrin repeat protein